MSAVDKAADSTKAVLPFECKVYQSYIRGLKAWWKNEAYRAVMADAAPFAGKGVVALETELGKAPSYQLYGWLERHLQQFKYVGRWGLVPVIAEKSDQLGAILKKGALEFPERLKLDPAFKVPDYVTRVDTHQHPGSTWSDDYDAFVHESATAGFSFTLGDSEQLVERYARPLVSLCNPRDILDLGCSTGKSSRAFKTAAPQANVFGCDVSAPVLRLAHVRAVEQGMHIEFSQQSAEKLNFADGSFDLVASHWLYHEMPPTAIRRAIREARRVLRPGGVFAIYDMCAVPGGVVGEWLHAGYAARNNEPFAYPLVKLDFDKELRAAGFGDVKLEVHAPPGDRMPASRTHYMAMVTAVAQ